MRRLLGVVFFLMATIPISISVKELGLAEQKVEKEISFTTDIQPILTKSCAVPECHTGPKPAKGLVLDAAKAYFNLVKVKSKESPRQMRVAPGDLDKSYLFDKITGNHNDGDRMPPKKRLPKESIELVKSWILAGAPEDAAALVQDSSTFPGGNKSIQTNK